jgi:uncharacterized SAM-binding protein YcdF (DUF218 family)
VTKRLPFAQGEPKPPPRWCSRLLVFLLGSGSLLFFVFASALAAADQLLVVHTGVEVTDAIVVLGGDAPPRAARAVQLYRQRFAPRVLISGDGDCVEVRELMIEAGVPEGAIEVECASHSTFENALFTAPMLEAAGASSALLITSSFHTRRTLGCFHKVAPDVRWIPVAADPDQPVWRMPWDRDGIKIAKEYLKVGWYVWHYGVS